MLLIQSPKIALLCDTFKHCRQVGWTEQTLEGGQDDQPCLTLQHAIEQSPSEKSELYDRH